MESRVCKGLGASTGGHTGYLLLLRFVIMMFLDRISWNAYNESCYAGDRLI